MITLNIEQKLNAIYAVMALGAGFLSASLSSLTLSALIPLSIYIASFVAVRMVVKSKKTRWLLINTFITYLLVWIVSWIFLHNSG